MSTRLIVPPAALAVSLEAARAAARVDVDESGASALDSDIEQAVRSYTEEAEHATGRRFILQTWELTLDGFSGSLRLDGSPLAEVLSVRFRDPSGIWQALDPQDYDVDTKSEPGWVVPAPGRTWPATANRIGSVEVQYRSGYGETEASVPAAVKQYILARVQQQFAPVPNAKAADFEGLLDRARVYA